MRLRLILAAAAALALAASPAFARQETAASAIDCPTSARESQMQALESRIDSLRTRLDSLDMQLQSFEIDRRQALDDIKASVEQVAHDPFRSREELDSAVADALSRADQTAAAFAASADSAHSEMAAVKAQLDALVQQLHTLAKASGSARAEG